MSDDGQTLAITIVYEDQRVDLVVSAALPLAELLPGMVAHLGRLNAMSATYGFDLVTSSGRAISPARSLTAQQVPAGSVLTLASRSAQELPRYDDITEAVGTVVESTQQPWGRPQSLQLSAWSAAALSLMAAVVLLLRGGGSLTAIAAGFIGAIVVIAAAGAVSRMGDVTMAVGLFAGACALMGATGWNLAFDYSEPWRVVTAAAGIAAASIGAFVFPGLYRPIAFGALAAGVFPALAAGLLIVCGVSWLVAAGVAAAAALAVEALLPSLGLALIPARRQALTLDYNQAVPDEVTGQVQHASVAVTAIRLGIGVAIVAAAPLLIASWWGIALIACCALSLSLGVRNLYARADVYASVVAATALVLIAALVAMWSHPSMALALIAALVIAVVLLALHTMAPPRYRPGFDRALGLVHVIATIAVIPLAVLNWGVF